MAQVVLAIGAAAVIAALVSPDKPEKYGSCPTLGNAVRKQLDSMKKKKQSYEEENEDDTHNEGQIGGLQPRSFPQVLKDGGQNTVDFDSQMRAMTGEPRVGLNSKETENVLVPGSSFRKELYNWASDPAVMKFAEESVSSTRNDLRPRKQIKVGPGIGLGYGPENSRYTPRIYPQTADDLNIQKKVDNLNQIPAGKNPNNVRPTIGTIEIMKTAQESNKQWGSFHSGAGGHGERRDGILTRSDKTVTEKMVQGGGRRHGGPIGRKQRIEGFNNQDNKEEKRESFQNKNDQRSGGAPSRAIQTAGRMIPSNQIGAVQLGDRDGNKIEELNQGRRSNFLKGGGVSSGIGMFDATGKSGTGKSYIEGGTKTKNLQGPTEGYANMSQRADVNVSLRQDNIYDKNQYSRAIGAPLRPKYSMPSGGGIQAPTGGLVTHTGRDAKPEFSESQKNASRGLQGYEYGASGENNRSSLHREQRAMSARNSSDFSEHQKTKAWSETVENNGNANKALGIQRQGLRHAGRVQIADKIDGLTGIGNISHSKSPNVGIQGPMRSQVAGIVHQKPEIFEMSQFEGRFKGGAGLAQKNASLNQAHREGRALAHYKAETRNIDTINNQASELSSGYKPSGRMNRLGSSYYRRETATSNTSSNIKDNSAGEHFSMRKSQIAY
jgi:hypothetical protein